MKMQGDVMQLGTYVFSVRGYLTKDDDGSGERETVV